jgi:hypothetical protein
MASHGRHACGARIRRVTQALQTISGGEVEWVGLGVARVHAKNDSISNALIDAIEKAGFKAFQEQSLSRN